MKNYLALFFFLLCGCSSRAATDPTAHVLLAHPNELSGSYFNQSVTYKTALYLSTDGKGAMLSRNNDNSFKQIMTFKWGVDNGLFYMSDIYFSKDAKKILKAISDSHTAYKLAGQDLFSRGPSGEWIDWRRTSKQPDRKVIDAIITK